MSDWKPNLYLTYEKERTQPSIDLVMRIEAKKPKRIIDIGCGPGNSINILKTRWQDSEIIGLDNSKAMLEEAKTKYSGINWVYKDMLKDLSELGKFDIVFSNAAIQWVTEQELLIEKLFGLLNENGVLAVQVPCTKFMPIHIELIKLISSEKWKGYFSDFVQGYSKHTADFYYNILCKLTDKIDLWETNYFHIMNNHSEIVKWYSGSGLRIYLDCFKDDTQNKEFLTDYEAALKESYPIQSNNKILFPFTRIFFIANK